MTRHISDKPRSHGTARLRAFLRHEREEGLHPAIRTLLSRPKTEADGARPMREFARIERGRLA